MNLPQHKHLKTNLLALLFVAFVVTPAMLTSVAAKSIPSKTQPKAQLLKLSSKPGQKNEPKVRATNVQRASRSSNENSLASESRATRNKAQTSASKKSQRAAELRAAEARRAEIRRQAEASRLAAIARQRAADEAMRNEVQAMISRDNTAGEDMEVRAAAVKALGNHAGTVVVMDPKTGRVYSMVNQEWAVRRGFKPCSTIKLVTGMAGLNEGVIDQGGMERVFGNGNHPNLTRALAYSQNEYFQQVGGRVGLEKMISYSRQLGLGEKTGINSSNESKGQIPSLQSGPSGRIYSHGDDFKVTPLQLATLVSAMANGGKLLTPRIAREDGDFKPKVRRVVKIAGNTFASMIPGMVGAVNYGSGRKAHHSGASVAGKTGTCIENGTWVGLFASYAPTVNPRLAVVVIARGPDARGHFPAAVAGRIYRDLNARFGTPTYLPVAANSSSRKQIDNEEELGDNEEELGEERTNNASLARRTPPVQIRATESVETFDRFSGPANNVSNNKVRRVLMTIPTVSEAAKKPAETKSAQSQTRPRRVSQL